MDSKLNLLLDKINLNKSLYYLFNGGDLEKIICNKDKTEYCFCINISSVLPIFDYFTLIEALTSFFGKEGKITLKLKTTKLEDTNLKDYFNYLLDEYKDESPLLEIFKDSEIKMEGNTFTIEVANKAEAMKLEKYQDDFENKFNDFGFNNIKMAVVINKQKAVKLDEIIESPKIVIKKEEDIIILGEEIKGKVTTINNIISEENNIIVDAYIFGADYFESSKSNFKIVTLKITDYTDSIYCKVFSKSDEEYQKLCKKLKPGNWIKIRGYIKNDVYSRELVLNARDINVLHKESNAVFDDAEEKRVELHTHTFMSQMDGLIEPKTLVKEARKRGYKAIAVTDHNGCQAFPDAYHVVRDMNKSLKDGEEPFKVIYGSELVMINDSVNVVIRPNDSILLDNTYVVFDFETTGFNSGGGDSIIEVGAVKMFNGEIIDKFSELINPGRKLPSKITEITGITDEMLENKPNEEDVIKKFVAWYGDLPMVAHNAKFDVSFLEMAYQKYNLGSYNNTVIDTLELSRTLDTNYARHSLSALVKRYDIPWDENAHHRGDYDAEGTALIFHKMMLKLSDRNMEKVSDLEKLVSKDEIHKYGRSYHINVLVKNKIGLKNLFKIISLANTKYLYKTPRILRSEIIKYRKGLLIGSGCYESEIFVEGRSKSEEELSNLVKFYDYVEVQPPECYNHLLQMNDFANQNELLEHLKKVIKVSEEAGAIVVATGDVHHLNEDDKIFREIIVNQKVPGGGRHPLARNNITNIPSMHFRTTKEMFDAFSFLDEEKAREIIVTNTNKIADMIEIIEVIIETGGVPFSPKIDKSVETVTKLVYDKASSWYGNPLPYSIEERIAKELYGDGIYASIKEELSTINLSEEELIRQSFSRLHEVILKGFDEAKKVIKDNIIKNEPDLDEAEVNKKVKKSLGGIIGGGFDVIYLIAQKLVKKSNDDGYIVGSRGSVGSSFVATMMGITEVNPLAPHYRCPKCLHSTFEDDNGEPLSNTYSSGFDLPDKYCPKCNSKMIKDGNDMPFATFLGFNADKVPDIDLNFSDLNQASAHEYTKVLFGVDNVYRAGTIGTVADKTAFGYVKGYCEDKGIFKRTAEVERLALGCTGVKRTTGQHPGGIVVIPGYMDVFDFTPFQFPADDATSAWRTTHFDYHAIDEDVLKLDILGHSDPTQLRLIQDLSGDNVIDVPLDDKETMGIFLSPKPLGVSEEEIMNKTGTLGIPEFGTPFTIGLVSDTKPTTFAELIKISGLSHGTDVWLGNAKELIDNNVIPFREVIGCRDDIMVYLMQKGMKPIKAFKIMEFVRKGKASKDPASWADFAKEMKEAGIEDWYIESCRKIKYMFPKAHATAYVTSAFRIAWYKVHKPEYFYASWFSTKATDFDIEVMIKGYSSIKRKIEEIVSKGYDATNKENGILECLRLALEMTARGLKFGNVDLMKSDAMYFKIADDHKTLIPPFKTIDGLGDTVANKIVSERENKYFLSIEDLQKRGKVSGTIIDKMKMMGILDGLDESSQLTLF
ncbi:MAG: PolC-type DNA polymerase III [Bacilli bacterium]|nr:PolC-type DNA polymerase III [Bacilli bacterium]